MKRIRIHHPGGPDVLTVEETPVPAPGPGQVLIKSEAGSLNHLDLWVRKGLPFTPYPLTPGSDCAGTVHACGRNVTRFKPGDRVVVSPGFGCRTCPHCLTGDDNLCRDYHIFGESADGLDAGFVTVDEHLVFLLPPEVSFSPAAAATLTYLTAWQMVADKGQVRPGDSVFVWGGSSGVGSAAIQIARHLGAVVYSAASTKEKREVALACGAEAVWDYKSGSVLSEVRALTGKRGVDLVIEHTGAETLGTSVQMTAKGGKIVTCGATTGWDARLDLRHIFFRQLSLLGSTMGRQDRLPVILNLMASGKLRPVIGRELSMWEIKSGHELLEGGQVAGKIVLIP